MSSSLTRRFVNLRKRCIARGLLPFSWGAAPTYRHFRARWRDGVPRTLIEKIQYKLIHDRRDIVRVYSDKLAVRDYVRAIAPSLRLPRILAVFERTSDVMAHLPPAPWVMKASHGSAMVLIATPERMPPPAEIRKRAGQWLATDYSFTYWEWHYHRLPRRILFEEFLGSGTEPPEDYKFYVIHQKVRLITVDRGRYGQHTRNLFHPDWTPILSGKGNARPAAIPPPRPDQLAEMIAAAEALACDTDFVRVDFYCVRGIVYFGELTHAPGAGDPSFEDPALDLELGGHWTLPARYEDVRAQRNPSLPPRPSVKASVA